MEEYKGIYYGDEKEKQFFEGGAHFKYIKLYKILENLAKERNLEKGKELYVIKKNIFNNNNFNKKKLKELKSRNIPSYLYSNKASYNTLSIHNLKNSINNKDRNKEIVINKVNKINKKKNIKKNFIIHNNTFLTKSNFNNQFMKIINEPSKQNKIQLDKTKTNKHFTSSNKKLENKKKIDKNILNKFKLNQSSFTKFIKKSRNLNGIYNASNSLNTIMVNKGIMNSTTTNKNIEKYRNNFKTMVLMDTIPDKISINQTYRENIKSKSKLNINNKSIQNNLEILNKSTPKIKKKLFMNSTSASNNINQYSKTKLLIKPYSQIKVNNNGFKNKIKKSSIIKSDLSISNNTISDVRNKTLNNNKIKTIGVYVKPKHFQCCLKKKSVNNKNINLNKIDKIDGHISSFTNTQKPIVKKKAIIKLSK